MPNLCGEIGVLLSGLLRLCPYGWRPVFNLNTDSGSWKVVERETRFELANSCG